MPKCVYLVRDEGALIRERLEEAGCEVLVGNGTSYNEEYLSRCEALVIGKLRCTEDVLEKAPNLKIVAKFGVGIDRVDVEACTRRGIYVANTPRSNYISVAEHTMMLMLAVAKQVYPIQKYLRCEKPDYWCRNRYEGIELCGKTLCILGLGNIGRRVAQLAQAFEMRVIGYDPYLPAELVPNGVERIADLHDALQQADVVSIHIPGSNDTTHLIGEKELAVMKPTAILLNLARGFVVDEQALTEALQSGRLAGAGLDVFAEEPNLDGNPLLLMENVVATPHCAGNTADARRRSQEQTAENILAAFAGERPKYALNQIKSERTGQP
jgi:D-3-phosphoglycerate dehydrogenase